LITTKSPVFFPFALASAVDSNDISDSEFVPDIAGAFVDNIVADIAGAFVAGGIAGAFVRDVA
jgi:hypothetical protein